MPAARGASPVPEAPGALWFHLVVEEEPVRYEKPMIVRRDSIRALLVINKSDLTADGVGG